MNIKVNLKLEFENIEEQINEILELLNKDYPKNKELLSRDIKFKKLDEYLCNLPYTEVIAIQTVMYIGRSFIDGSIGSNFDFSEMYNEFYVSDLRKDLDANQIVGKSDSLIQYFTEGMKQIKNKYVL